MLDPEPNLLASTMLKTVPSVSGRLPDFTRRITHGASWPSNSSLAMCFSAWLSPFLSACYYWPSVLSEDRFEMAISVGEIFAHSEYVPQLSAGNALLPLGTRPIKHHGSVPMDKILAHARALLEADP